MKKKSTAASAFVSLRGLMAPVLCVAAACWVVSGTLLPLFRADASSKIAHPATAGLTFAERVAYQRPIDEVYWQHRIWPEENANPKPSLDAVMSQADLEEKVEGYLRKSQALKDYWQRPITPDQLQVEMQRIASDTKQPAVLSELFAALGNDPFVIAECLARPVPAERLVTELYAYDERFHGESKRRAESELLAHPSVEQMKHTNGNYREIELVKTDNPHERGVKVNSRE